MSSFFFSQNPLARRTDMMQSAVDGLYEASGISPDHKKNAAAVLDTLNAGRHAEEFTGATVQGDKFEVEHVETSGDIREVYMHRKNESGSFEHVKVIEERTGDGTFIAKEKQRV